MTENSEYSGALLASGLAFSRKVSEAVHDIITTSITDNDPLGIGSFKQNNGRQVTVVVAVGAPLGDELINFVKDFNDGQEED